MKTIFAALCAILVMASCQPQGEVDNSANEAFERNSKTIKDFLESFQNGTVDYSIYADDFVLLGTGFGDKDSISLAEMKENDAEMMKMLKIEIIGDLVLLPGVNKDTKQMDGSVRYYGRWKITKLATDSTEVKSGILKAYESFDFNEEGKVLYQQGYGDFSGLMMYLMGDDEHDDAEGDDDDE